MAYRNIYVTNKSKVYIKDNHLVVNTDDFDIVSVYLDDIKSVIIESPYTTVSASAVTELASRNINIVFCDKKHIPKVSALALYGLSDKKHIITKQLEYEYNDLLWQQTVMQKIENQAETLKQNGLPYENILLMKDEVKIGDSTCREATAARMYFPLLFGKDFNRRNGNNNINAALNYGYSILRSQISKSLVSCGLEPSIGIHHRNQFNAFNLSDDIIECFRPTVDNCVYKNKELLTQEFDIFMKSQLILLLNEDAVYNNQICQVSTAIENTVNEMKKAILSNKKKIEFVKLKKE